MMEFILSHVEKGVMTLTLNRPERLNSFNDEMHAQLAECLKQVERDDTIRCLLLTGAGRGFCAGQDLNDRNVDPTGPAPDLGMSVERFYNPLVRRLAKLPKPVKRFIINNLPDHPPFVRLFSTQLIPQQCQPHGARSSGNAWQ
mgnify:CR=1 FL=1